MSEATTKYRAPALERGLDILELLSEQDEPLAKKDIAEKLNRSVSELFRMLNILEARGYIAIDEESGKYRLTLKTFELSNHHPPLERLLNAAGNELAELADRTQQSCHIAIHHDDVMLIVAQKDSPYKMGFSIRIGARIDIHGSGSGLTMLAYRSPEERLKILERTSATQTEIENALSQMEKIGNQGYFVGVSPQVNGVTNITYPIFNSKQRLEAVVTMPFLTLNSDSLHHQVVSFEDSRLAVARAARNLTAALGGKPLTI